MGEHPDVPWQFPATLPPRNDIAAGVSTLEAQLKPVDRSHAGYCLSKLLVGFNERKTADEAKLLLAVWLEACGDLPDDLWSAGTLELLQTHKFGMPKPVHLRDAVAKAFSERSTKLRRARDLLKAADGEHPERPAEKPIETRLGRLEHTRAIYQRMGRRFDVDRMDREIAKERGEPVGVMAPIVDAETYARDRAEFKPDTTQSAVRCAELAAAHRTGKPAPARDWESVPEAAHGA